MKKLLMILFFLISLNSVFAANIQGNIYDIDLNKLENSILIINTKPEQTIVLRESSYALDIPKGNYKIKAFYYENGFLEAYVEEELSVYDEGNYTLDLILFPSLAEEDILFNQSNFEFESGVGLEKTIPTLFGIVIALAIILFFIFKFRKRSIKGNLEKELGSKLDDILLTNVLDVIKKNDGRTTQKAIRKELKISEAKLSLILSQLENEGKIKKIKKGRGNIIVLN